MSAAAAGVVVKDGDDETGKGKAAGGAQGLTQDEKAQRSKQKNFLKKAQAVVSMPVHTGKCKAGVGAQGLTQDEKAKQSKRTFDDAAGRSLYACSHGQQQGRGKRTGTYTGGESEAKQKNFLTKAQAVASMPVLTGKCKARAGAQGLTQDEKMFLQAVERAATTDVTLSH